MCDFSSPIKGQIDGGLHEDRELVEAKKELETWRAKVEKADDVKARLILEKLGEDEVKMKAQGDLEALIKKQQQCQEDFSQSMKRVQEEVIKLGKRKQDLMKRMRSYQDELEQKRAESTKLKQKFKIHAEIPDMEVKFTRQEEGENEDNGQAVRGVFSISQRPGVLLQGGQALITFEEEKVVSQILKLAKHSVACEDVHLDVKPKRIKMGPAVKFELHLDVSRKKLKFSNAPPSMSEERMKDRLEMSFSRPSRGGGEVERVSYDKNTGTGQITFLHAGAAEGLALRGSYQVDLDSEVNVQVFPVYDYQLRKFQTFCGASKRTILLDDIQDVADEEDLQDHLEIHFQKPSNYGGEIESIKYVSGGKSLQTFFCEDKAETQA